MKPSSSAGSQSSFMRDLASSLVSFSPRLIRSLNEVVESTLVLGVLASFVHGVDFGLGEHLLSLFCLTSDLIDGLECGVQVAGTDEIAGIEGINIAISLEVINIKGKFN